MSTVATYTLGPLSFIDNGEQRRQANCPCQPTVISAASHLCTRRVHLQCLWASPVVELH